MAISELFQKLNPDEWRKQNPFSTALDEATKKLIATTSHDEATAVLSEWLFKHQPCFFGKISVSRKLQRFCFLFEDDLNRDDDHIKAKIQDAKIKWKQDAWLGNSSGFILLAVSERLANSRPDDVTKEFARQLCALYLDHTEAKLDEVILDSICLDIPSRPHNQTYEWNVGINYFGAHGDGRWWQDHRIPGGVGFSLNSVGHMVRCHQVSDELIKLQKNLKVTPEEAADTAVASLDDALRLAMKTINKASAARSGPATKLLNGTPEEPRCPIDLKDLSGKNHYEYSGWYNTDITIPSEYFMPDADRPGSVQDHRLYFDYLFDPATYDLKTMGHGVRIRNQQSPKVAKHFKSKALKAAGVEISLEAAAEMKKSLGLK